MHYWCGVQRGEFHRRVSSRRRCPADQQGHFEAFALQLPRHMRHLLQGGRDQSRETDHIRPRLTRCFKNTIRWNHHAQVRNLEVVARQHDADDVLANVVHVALDGGQQHACCRPVRARLLRSFEERGQIGHGLLHHARALDDLGQEHLALAE